MATYQYGPYDKLFAGLINNSIPVSIIFKKVGAGGVYVRGTAVGKTGQLPAGNEFAGMVEVDITNSANATTAKTVYGILADEVVDTRNGDVRATAYVTGEFNRDALIFGGTDTVATHEDAMKIAGMYTRRVVY